jgi:cystathionine beta-lyase/cystathionine gamma-synthase
VAKLNTYFAEHINLSYLGANQKKTKMKDQKMLNYLRKVLENMPEDWLRLTTHRLDIYVEKLAKTQFLERFEDLFQANNADVDALNALPTAYDYIRLGHPLSSVLEWALAQLHGLKAEQVISFSSQTTPILAVLRKNLFEGKKTQILYADELPTGFDAELITSAYNYSFELKKLNNIEELEAFEGSTILVSNSTQLDEVKFSDHVDFYVNLQGHLGSIIYVNTDPSYISEIQHVRRRESIAMTPANCLKALKFLVNGSEIGIEDPYLETNKAAVLESIRKITNTEVKAVVGSSGLSIQYAIMMGLVHEALVSHPGKAIKIVVPTNCYGGTNDQARRLAACIPNAEIVDLLVDREHDMVESINKVLTQIAKEDAVPYIIAEIPTNPRLEVPNLEELKAALEKVRKTEKGKNAVDPVFILDQTFCPNVQFLGEEGILSKVRTISYVSGSKFPSGGRCTAGYCTANQAAAELMPKIEQHLKICDNEATDLQLEILAKQMPSMLDRIQRAYENTRAFVNYIQETLPAAKINFVSEELAQRGFTPSVFSLDLPTKGDTHEERETYKRKLNQRLIHMMITEIPMESKYCVSYGQLKGCYWTIPATSTQGTTKEKDKDYIARVSVSANLDLEHHKQVFADFVKEIGE